jgi:hypothetical protein
LAGIVSPCAFFASNLHKPIAGSGGCQRVGQASRLSPFKINVPPLNGRQTRRLKKRLMAQLF